jgi:hypothetical protein
MAGRGRFEKRGYAGLDADLRAGSTLSATSALMRYRNMSPEENSGNKRRRQRSCRQWDKLVLLPWYHCQKRQHNCNDRQESGHHST